MTGHLISWPVVILIIVLLLLRQIKELLPSLQHARFGQNVEFDFRQQVEELEEQAEQAQLPPPVEEVRPTPLPTAELEKQQEEVRKLQEVARQRREEAQRLEEEHQQRLEEAIRRIEVARQRQEEIEDAIAHEEERQQQIEDARQQRQEEIEEAIAQREQRQQQMEDVRRQVEENERQVEEARRSVEEARRRREEAEERWAQQQRERQEQIDLAREQQRLSMLYLLADTNPTSGVLEAWRQVEHEAMRLAERANINRPLWSRNSFHVLRALHDTGVIDANVAEIADQLRQLRNRAAHHPEPDISSDDAKEYIDLAERVAQQLRQSLRS